MLRKNIFAPLLAASALALTVATPAHAGKSDRAREAIAAAEAKIHTAETMGAATQMPDRNAAARAALATAKENLKSSYPTKAIENAIQAQSLADATIGELQQRKDQALANAQDARATDVAVAQQQAAAAQDQAAAADARASAAERSAAAAAAEAQAARAAAEANVETTVTTGAGTATRPATTVTRKTTTTRRAPAAPATTTTTTVRTTN